MDTQGLVTLIVIAIAVLVFILCREFLCWYFKLTRIEELLSKINDKIPGKEGTSGEDKITPKSFY